VDPDPVFELFADPDPGLVFLPKMSDLREKVKKRMLDLD